MKTSAALLVFMLVTLGQYAFTQETSQDSTKAPQLSLIVKNDGSEYIGVILSDDGREILLETKNLGKIYIAKSDIKNITKIENEADIVYGEYRQDGPFTTRYSFTTNALPIKKGENYALVNLYGPEVHFALSDRFSLGIMTTWIVSPFVLAAKYTFKTNNEKVNFSIGSLFGSSGYLNNFRGYGGLHFANLTFGSRSKNITFSGGFAHFNPGNNTLLEAGTVFNNQEYLYSYSGSGFSWKSPNTTGPIFSVAGIVKVGAKASFVFDSMIGVFSQKRHSVSTTTITPPSYDPEYLPGYYKHTITQYLTTTTALFIMPGMRFQKTDKSAFQVSLAGVSVFRWIDEQNNGDQFNFPVPLLMWFFKF